MGERFRKVNNIEDHTDRKDQRWNVSQSLFGPQDHTPSTASHWPPNLQRQVPLLLLPPVATPGLSVFPGAKDYPIDKEGLCDRVQLVCT